MALDYEKANRLRDIFDRCPRARAAFSDFYDALVEEIPGEFSDEKARTERALAICAQFYCNIPDLQTRRFGRIFTDLYESGFFANDY